MKSDKNDSTGPKLILILRHGEKPGDPEIDDDSDGPHLSTRGFIRAAALSVYLPATFGKIDFVFATQPSASSNRPAETIGPLATAIGVTPNLDYADKAFGDLATLLQHDGTYAGKTVVIAWHHGKIPELAAVLGAANAPRKWSGKVFDRIWRIDGPLTAPAFSDLPQQLLYGDSSD